VLKYQISMLTYGYTVWEIVDRSVKNIIISWTVDDEHLTIWIIPYSIELQGKQFILYTGKKSHPKFEPKVPYLKIQIAFWKLRYFLLPL
jgi:hypothetical protein